MRATSNSSPARIAAPCSTERKSIALTWPIVTLVLTAFLPLSGCLGASGLGGLGGMSGLGGMNPFGATTATPQERAMNVEPMLTAAGFQTLAPQKTEHQQQLAALPALTMNTYTTAEGQQRYWYADPSYCHCMYVGDAGAYQRYETLKLQNQQLQNEQQAQQQQMQMQQMQMQQMQMQQMQMMGPFGSPMGGYGSPFGFGMGGPGMGFMF
ncbi:MAG: hypothetical protein IVW54_09380 [Candidatus Binataceae bacterium]|nr:hypothetical protein [Candidatus Binataceae bacterium]